MSHLRVLVKTGCAWHWSVSNIFANLVCPLPRMEPNSGQVWLHCEVYSAYSLWYNAPRSQKPYKNQLTSSSTSSVPCASFAERVIIHRHSKVQNSDRQMYVDVPKLDPFLSALLRRLSPSSSKCFLRCFYPCLYSELFSPLSRSSALSALGVGNWKAKRKDGIGSLKFNRFTLCLWGPIPPMADWRPESEPSRAWRKTRTSLSSHCYPQKKKQGSDLRYLRWANQREGDFLAWSHFKK